MTWRAPWLVLLCAAGAARAQAPDAGTLVSAPRNRTAGATSLRGAEAREGLLVEHDGLKAVQTFAGVARAAPGSGALVVWGAAPGETKVEVDGIEVPTLFHLGGYRSVLGSAMVGRVELEPAHARPDVGRGLGGVVRVETARPALGVHGETSTDLSDTSATLSLAGDAAAVAAAGRVGTLAAVLTPLLEPTTAERFVLPQSWDAQLKGTWAPSADDELTVLGLASGDLRRVTLDSTDPSLARGRKDRADFYRLGLSWRRGSPGEGLAVTAWGGLDRNTTELSTPLATARTDARTWLGGLKARWRGGLTDGVAAVIGVDALVSSAGLERAGPLTLPPREGDVTAWGEPLSDDRAADRWSVVAVDAAIFAGFDLTLGPLAVSPGLRLAGIGADVSRSTPRLAATPAIGASTLEFALEPRLSASLAAADWLSFAASAGLSHQAADAADQSAVFGSPTLGPAHGGHTALGLVLKPVGGLTLEATGFYRAANHLAVRDREVQARLAQSLVQSGEARAGGLSAAASARWRGLWASLVYTLSRSERRDDSTSPWRLADVDQTHVLTATTAYSWRGWRAGARCRWASGAPRAPVVSSVFDVRRGVYEPVFGPQGSTRLPDFFQVDLEAGKTLTFARWWVELFVEVLNLTNQKNVEEWAYDSTFTQRRPLDGVPLFGTLGLRGGF